MAHQAKPQVAAAGTQPKPQVKATAAAAAVAQPKPQPKLQRPLSSRPNRSKVAVSVSANVSVSEQQAQAEAQSMTVARKSVLFVLAVGVAYGLYLVLSGQLDEFVTALAGVDTSWVCLALVCYGLYYVLGVSAYALAVVADPTCKVGIRDLMSVEASGIFFYNLTPNGAGGPPSQIYRLIRAGLSVGAAGALQYTRFIIYEAGEGIFAALMLLFRGTYFIETYGDVFFVASLLFGFKILEVFFLLAVCFWPQVISKLGRGILRLLAHIPVLTKRCESWTEALDLHILEFSEGFKNAAKNVPEMLITLVVTLFQLGCLYALPWFVLRAFDLPADLLTCLACGSMLELLTSAIPLPGGTFGAEGGFAFLFSPMFGVSTPAGYVIWRLVEYFLPILCSIPLLGMRSHSGITVYARYRRLRTAWIRISRRIIDGPTRTHAAGVRVHVGSGGLVVIKSTPGVKHAAISSDYVRKVVLNPKTSARPSHPQASTRVNPHVHTRTSPRIIIDEPHASTSHRPRP